MDDFKEYLQKAQDGLKNLEKFDDIKLILGNETCDLDSTISSLLLGFFIYMQSKNNRIHSTLILPILNTDEGLFLLRTDSCYVLKQCGIDTKDLIYRNQVNMEDLLQNKTVCTHLVDHHLLTKRDNLLKDTVVQIFDHRPVDPSCSWNQVDTKILEVGSCATLIADEIMTKNCTILTKPLAFLLYEVIIYDTIALLPENGKAKELDIEIAEKLEEKFNFIMYRKTLFDELWAAHNDVSHLTPRQLLLKDLKIVDGVPVPGLPMLVENYLKLPNVVSCIEEFSREYNTSLIVFIGLEAKREVKRDIAIYFKTESDLKTTLNDIFIKNLMNSRETNCIDFDLIEQEVDCRYIRCFRQNNTKLSRKQIIPILKNSLVEYNSV